LLSASVLRLLLFFFEFVWRTERKSNAVMSLKGQRDKWETRGLAVGG
jgi:hypothetical protein